MNRMLSISAIVSNKIKSSKWPFHFSVTFTSTFGISRSYTTRYWTKYERAKAKTLSTLWTHTRQPTLGPYGQAMGRLFSVVWRKHTTRCRKWHYNDVMMGAIASQITNLTIVYSTVYSGWDLRKLQSSASLAFMRGIQRDRWIPRTKGQ